MERRTYLIVGVAVLLAGAVILIVVNSLRSRRQAALEGQPIFGPEVAAVVRPSAILLKGPMVQSEPVPEEVSDAELEQLMKGPQPPSAALGQLQGEYDTNLDGKIDKQVYYRRKVLSKVVMDTNFDGEMDQWWHYARGKVKRAEDDTNHDGEVDQWGHYAQGVIARMEFDTNYDQKADKWVSFKGGLPVEIMIDTDYDGKADKKVTK